MLTIQQILSDPLQITDKLNKKNFPILEAQKIISNVANLDVERKKNQLELDNILAQINSKSKEIGTLMAQKNIEQSAILKGEVSELKQQVPALQNRQNELENQIKAYLIVLPNIPHNDVPMGKLPTDNEEIKIGGSKVQLPENAQCHWDLIQKYNLISFELGAKITGSGFPLFIGKGAKLQRALIQYFLDYNIDAGYTEYIPPFMVNSESAFATGQLPDKESQMYYMPADDFYMIPTAEVPITNIYRNTILKENELPIKMTAYSPCFRREAGSFGKDVRGLNRVHQFEKVEIIQIVQPENSYAVLNEMVAHVEGLLKSLDLHYRIIRLCGGDMGFASAMTFDFEVYSAAQQRWLEVSSVTNFEAFQANRLKCRYKNSQGQTQLVHTLNGSSLALPRIMAALLENNQSSTGIQIPSILQKYTGFSIISQ